MVELTEEFKYKIPISKKHRKYEQLVINIPILYKEILKLKSGDIIKVILKKEIEDKTLGEKK